MELAERAGGGGGGGGARATGIDSSYDSAPDGWDFLAFADSAPLCSTYCMM